MTKYYFELTVEPKGHYKQFLELLIMLSNSAIEEDKGTLILRSKNTLSNIEFGVKEFSKRIGVVCNTTCIKKPTKSWLKNYQQNMKAVEVEEFFIRPPWINKKHNKIDIIIEPSLSFGSGHHETTSSCILALKKFAKKSSKILDVGCGSGILSIVASKIGCKVDMCDIDKSSIKSSIKNFELNKVAFHNSWVGSANKAAKQYDIVISNIVADVLIKINKDLKKCLKDDGILIVSGILEKYQNKVLNTFSNLKKLKTIHKNEWVTIAFSK